MDAMKGKVLIVLVFIWIIYSDLYSNNYKPEGISINDSRSKMNDEFFNNYENSLVWYWEDSFTDSEKRQVEAWIREIYEAAESTLGYFPFKIHIHIYLRQESEEPVPWANTWRYPNQSLHFYIDPDYSQEDFLADWTAPHEFSHLSLPYLGESDAWFAEGYASFMQYQIMAEMGIYSKDEIYMKYMDKIKDVKSSFLLEENFIAVARNFYEEHNFRPMYWGSCIYFLILDEILQEKYKMNLCQLITEYQNCCRLKGRSLDAVVTYWDEILGSPEASNLLEEFRTETAIEILQRSERLAIFQ
jgi:hypothetical protein